jgi:hypothetical protein
LPNKECSGNGAYRIEGFLQHYHTSVSAASKHAVELTPSAALEDRSQVYAVTRLEGSGERRYFTLIRSMSKISVAPGGMSPPAPLVP